MTKILINQYKVLKNFEDCELIKSYLLEPFESLILPFEILYLVFDLDF